MLIANTGYAPQEGTSSEIRQPKTPLIRQSALIEIGLFFLVALAIDIIFGARDRFFTVQPHPFWIIVLLASVQYGVKEGLLAAAASTVVLLFGNMPERKEGFDAFTHLYDVFLNPVLWFMAALVLGEMRQRHVRRQQKQAQDLYESRLREESIAEKYSEVRKIKENLEMRVAGQLRTAFSTYEAARAIEAVEPKAVVSGVENLIGSLIGAERYSIFLFRNNKLELQTAHGWPSENAYPREYDASSPLYQEMVVKGKVLNIVNEDDERKLQGHGVLAGCFYDILSGRIFGVLKIESMGFGTLNFSTIESFKVLCEWVGAAYGRAVGFQAVKKSSMINPESQVLSGSYLRQQAIYIPELAKRAGFDASLISISMVGANKINEKKRRDAARALGKILSTQTRKIDQLFEESLNNPSALPHSEFTVILPSTPVSNASIVVQKIQRQLNLNNEPALAGVELQFNIQSLFQHKAAA